MTGAQQMTQPRKWVRHSAGERMARSLIYVGAAIAVVWSVKNIEVIPEFLYDAPEQAADLFKRMWPFDWAFYPKAIHSALIETFHIATLGTILSLFIALPLSFLAARNFTKNPLLNLLAQFIFVSSRSVNSLIWALFSEALEEAQQGSIEALTATGAPKSMLLVKGYWPQVEPSFWSVALLRWDINIRESAVLGLVGAGGIGVALDAALNNLYWDQVGLILAVIFAVVIATEIVTSTIRSRII
jgi:phosphonate transport system permease protein